MINRGQNFQQIPLNICGSSVFGRYPKISIESTYNMFQSDTFMVPYSGYAISVPASELTPNPLMIGKVGRGIYSSIKLGKLVVVVDRNVFLVTINQNQYSAPPFTYQVIFIGQLQTSTGVVYIAENNKPQILISDNSFLYIYDQSLTPSFQQVQNLDFTPGYITFHDTYFICAARQDNFYSPSATNTWRLSDQNDGTTWPNMAANIGLLQTKPDRIQAVVRFPSKGNMIFVMGSNVTESWFDTGAQLFPYQRNNQFNIDYGCLNPATVAYMDEIVVWLAANEKSGPIIMYSDGGMPEKITTDGIDYLFSQLTAPQDSQAFLYRQDGHLFYHINFYTDNYSLFYDFNNKKIYNASDHKLDYFIASQVAFYNNQYYFITKNNGNIFAFDTIYTTYEDVTENGTVEVNEIPRIRTCKNIRLQTQEYFVVNDVGFTIETGETNYQYTTSIVNGSPVQIPVTPAVDFSMSYDGGAVFGREWRYELFPIGQRRNKLLWWQCGIGNDVVPQFKFWGMGRFVVTDGVANIRQ